ncbi:MAG: PQQ-binding-like beta-propeller repeat protein [Thermoleophilia bacterium]
MPNRLSAWLWRRFVRRASWVVAVVAFCSTAVSPAAAAPPAPLVMPGWPKAAAAGRLFPGPGGGVVALSNVALKEVAAAYDVSGRLLWANQRQPGCGNCVSGSQRPQLWQDGTYGPLGATGSDYWAVDRHGRTVAGCKGPVLAGGACLVSLADFDPVRVGLNPGVALSRDGAEVWRHIESDLIWVPDMSDWPAPVVDLAGNVYAAFGNAYPGASGLDVTRVLALDAASGGLRWRRLMPARVVDGLESGVLVDHLGTTVALDAQGKERWRLDTALGSPVQAIPDPARGRVIVTLRYVDDVRVASLRLTDGTIQWITPKDRVVQSVTVGSSGTVYVGLDRSEFVHQVRAYRPDGTVAWLMPTGEPAVGALEMRDRTVMVATSNGWRAMLTRVDPRRTAPPVRETSIDIRPHRMVVGCGLICGLTRGRGGVLTIRTPVPVRVRFLVVGRDGKRRRSVAMGLPVDAQPGTTHSRFVAAVDDGVGPVTLEARWRVNGRLRSRQIHLTVLGTKPR